MTNEEMLQKLADDCWTFEAWSEHPPEKVYWVVKLTCGVQARGRFETKSESFDMALRTAYDHVTDKWG